MSTVSRTPRVSIQTKVLVAVLAVLVLLPAVTVWIVDRHIRQQVQDEAQQTLATAKAVFRQSLDNQSRDLISRFRNAVNEVSYQHLVLALADQASSDDAQAVRQTLEPFLRGRLEEYGPEHEVMALVALKDGRTIGAVRGGAFTLEQFSHAAESVVARALRGDPAVGAVGLGGRDYYVVAVPVPLRTRNDELVAVLTVGVQITAAALQDLKTLPHTEAVLVPDGPVTVTTLRNPSAVAGLLAKSWPAQDDEAPQPVLIDGEHFLAAAGVYGGATSGVRYLLLSSYEAQLRALDATRRTLIGVSLAGIALGALAVVFFVRRITQPLRELRDSAEAVGRGDFSQRIERFPNDECGDLAVAFNGMTANLQSSRAELEKTVETLKATQAQLIQSEKLSAVGQFVAGVAHELNNPLTSVIGFSELLSQTDANEQIRPHLQLIVKSAHRCHKIVQSLLSFARQHAPERRLLQLGSVVDDVLEIMAYDLRTSNVTIVREIPDGLPPILGDPHQLQQVFVNILGNARQALEPFRRDGQIVVRARVADGRVRLEFQDNGPGIRPENVSRIFDPFFTTKPVGKGTGLGLSLSYGIVQEHGGTIRVQSEPGYGATFVIELPVASVPPVIAGHAPAASLRRSRSPFPGVGEGKIVLVVEDEEWIVTLTEELLRHEGYRVASAANGDQALEAMQRVKFDVIVSDWKMPGMNGLQLYEHLLQHDPAAATRMLFMTGDVINSTFEDFLRRHGKGCLTKPFAIEEFREAVATIAAAEQ